MQRHSTIKTMLLIGLLIACLAAAGKVPRVFSPRRVPLKSGSQNAIGTGVMGGMISATVLAIFFVPLFFVLVRRLSRSKQPVTLPVERHELITAQEG